MLFIFNRLYGGDPTSQISDTVSIIAEAGTLDSISTYSSTDFYDQNKIENAIFTYLKESFADYYLTCTSVYIINMEFDYTYQAAISKISAETQRIAEKRNLLNGTQIQSDMNVAVSQITQKMNIALATKEGQVYQQVQNSKAQAIKTFYSSIETNVLPKIGTFITPKAKSVVYNFFYLLVALIDQIMKMSPTTKNLFLYNAEPLYTSLTS